jgi:hypothetical protein
VIWRKENAVKSDDGFFRHFLDATAPLLLWALLFFAGYVFVAVACDTALADRHWAGQPAILLILWGATIAVALAVLLLLVRAVALCRIAPRQLLSGARLGLAALGLLGIAWMAVPMLVLPACIE